MSSLTPFKSDGCSGVGPILNFFGYHNADIRACCIEHDRGYHVGGTSDQRRRVDDAFRRCLKAEGYSALAWVMWGGVRLFGRLPGREFKWGYGHLD